MPQMNRLSQMQNMVNTIRGAQNPQALLQNMVQNNPQINEAIKKYGDPQTAFYKIAEERGINPDDVLNMLK